MHEDFIFALQQLKQPQRGQRPLFDLAPGTFIVESLDREMSITADTQVQLPNICRQLRCWLRLRVVVRQNRRTAAWTSGSCAPKCTGFPG